MRCLTEIIINKINGSINTNGVIWSLFEAVESILEALEGSWVTVPVEANTLFLLSVSAWKIAVYHRLAVCWIANVTCCLRLSFVSS